MLVDTGIGVTDDETEAWYRPVRVSLADALATAAADLERVHLVVNCHLHFDHCGGNPALAGRPVVTQRTELQAARATGYTAPALVDFAGARYEELDGEAEVMAGLIVVPDALVTPPVTSLWWCAATTARSLWPASPTIMRRASPATSWG